MFRHFHIWYCSLIWLMSLSLHKRLVFPNFSSYPYEIQSINYNMWDDVYQKFERRKKQIIWLLLPPATSTHTKTTSVAESTVTMQKTCFWTLWFSSRNQKSVVYARSIEKFIEYILRVFVRNGKFLCLKENELSRL